MSDYIFQDPEVQSKILGMMQLAADKSLRFELSPKGEQFKITGAGLERPFYLPIQLLKKTTVNELLVHIGVPAREQ